MSTLSQVSIGNGGRRHGSSSPFRPPLRFSEKFEENEDDGKANKSAGLSYIWKRRDAMVAAMATIIPSYLAIPHSATAATDNETEKVVYQTITLPSGLKYIELREGTGLMPLYGQLLTIGYTGYVKVATKNSPKNSNEPPPMFDKVSEYLVKYGNRRLVPGLEEGIHTMKVGGLRRIIIPPKLGYVDIGLGPIPESPVSRYKLNRLLEQMIASKNGQVIFDVHLIQAFDDEADQGYYNDRSLTPEQFNTLRDNLERDQREAKKSGATSGIIGNEA
eukprot:CAMPEP_0172425666 /NCGR_PEP_ID=MMETSP1064-20121228/33390_1 /TAXON_ID=202472 /ORGANISM="Aulacoseira subarctica , Strain CCAP 1002/5" /LENGTH=274 /DNA_ID=CAMNT_0013168747 /DNA_START=139 /DNA_END=963 /DNA_ORIENTATION=-